MRRTGDHQHDCVNKKHGCKSSYACSNKHLERNYDGWPDVICSVNPMDEFECEDCDTSRCSECGEVLNVHQHDNDCPKATAV